MTNTTASGGARRDFLKTASAGLLLVKPETAFGYQANSTVEVGLVGCGGRGNWIAPFFPEFTGARVVAIADVVREFLDSTRAKLTTVEANRAYYGPDAYKELSSSKLDAVIIETPPYYHPEQVAFAIDQGRHVYVAKPVAVDVPGCRSISESGRKAAAKSLSLLVDFQSRAMPVYQEVAKRVHRGDIGKPVLAQIYYHADRPMRPVLPKGLDEAGTRLLNFYNDKVYGGDIIVEQNIHVIDIANWLLNGHPLKAVGTCGRSDWKGTKYDFGNGNDHFAVTFWYPNEVKAAFDSHQLTRALSDLCVRCFGHDGTADTHYGGTVRILGEKPYPGVEKEDTFRLGAINNVKTFIAAIKENKPFNNTEVSVESNLSAILGRMAAYKQQMVTWDEMMRDNTRLVAESKLRY